MDTSVASDEMSDMAFKKPLTLKAEVLKLKCGWKNCNYVTSEAEAFVKHVSSHIPHLGIKCNEDDDEGQALPQHHDIFNHDLFFLALK